MFPDIVGKSRSVQAGKEMATMLLSRTQGARPVTLIAYALLRGAASSSAKHEGRDGVSNVPRCPSVGRNSVGAVVAFSCLLELHRRHTVRSLSTLRRRHVARQLVPSSCAQR